MKTVIILQSIVIVMLFIMWIVRKKQFESLEEENELLKCEKAIQFKQIEKLTEANKRIGNRSLAKDVNILMLKDRIKGLKNHAREEER